MLVAPLLISALTGCYREEVASFPTDGIPFDAQVRYPNNFCPPWEQGADEAYEVVATAPEGWQIDTYDLPITCPDGEDSNFYLVYPSGASGPQKLAVFFHSGAFDYVIDPDLNNPLAGLHYQRRGDNQSENRLEREWAVDRVFATLGMACDRDAAEMHNGALPVALAERGVAMLFAANCWGDTWANDLESRPNAVTTEYIERRGFEAAEYMWSVATAPASVNVSLPITVNQDEIYLVGQGEGGRAVSQLIRAGHMPKAAVTDGYGDDLQAYWANPDAYGTRITGLDRMFPNGPESTRAGSLTFGTAFPARMGYVYSLQDARVARRAHEVISVTLAARPNSFVRNTESPVHINTAGEIDLSREIAAWLAGVQ